MIDYVRGAYACDRDWFKKPILLGCFGHFVAVRIFLLALVNGFRGRAFDGRKFVFDPKAIRISQLHCFVAATQTSFTAADVAQGRAFFAPPAAQKVLHARAHEIGRASCRERVEIRVWGGESM